MNPVVSNHLEMSQVYLWPVVTDIHELRYEIFMSKDGKFPFELL